MLDAERNRPGGWSQLQTVKSKSFVCPFCGNLISTSAGFNGGNSRIYVCPHCNFPTFFGLNPDGVTELQVPGTMPGQPVPNVPREIDILYQEARSSVAAGAHTASVLVCRKMLVDLAVSQGDTWERGKRFVSYVESLSQRVFAPSYIATWLDRIREDGNKATHELGIMTEDQALLLIEFIEMLLKVLFEYPQAAAVTRPAGTS